MVDIVNFYELDEVKAFQTESINPNYGKHGIKVPFRMLIVGASGAGKSNIVLNMIRIMNNTFHKIILYTRNKKEPLYEYLESKLEDNDDLLEVHEGLDHLRSVNIDKEYFGQTLIIFDDLVNEKNQDIIGEMFLRGRKIGISLMYLTQKYAKVPTLVREQLNYLIMKKISGKRDITYLMRNHALNGSIEQLLNMYQYCIDDKITNFLLIDLEASSERAFRKNFNDILNIEAF